MIPEIHRSLPRELFGRAMYKWAKDFPVPPRAIRKYGKPRDGDVVLDIGSYIGEFAIPASVWADRVFAVEASPVIYREMRDVYLQFPNIIPCNFAAWDENGFALLNLQDDTADTHVLPGVSPKAPQDGIQDQMTVVDRRRLSDIDVIPKVDYLKIDAEGYEPEVLRGLEPYTPARVAVDCSAERDGEKTDVEVVRWMHRNGYQNVDRRPGTVITGEL